MSPTVRAAAPAKLNLYLHVLGKRPDGYHDLDSLVVFCEAGDTVEATEADGLSLGIDGPFAPPLLNEPADRNLVVRAARALAEAVGRPPDVSLRLTKRLPPASGIGGGSSDAAATLRALAKLWRLAPDDPRPTLVAPRLGADVPVCLVGRSAYFSGLGERVEAVEGLPAVGLLLVNPGVPVATPPVFAARTGPFSRPGRFDALPTDAAALGRALASRTNDLETPARGLAPVIGEVLDVLQAAPGCRLARMSGSGATCFGLFDDRAAADAAAAFLIRPDWWVVATALTETAAETTPL